VQGTDLKIPWSFT